MWQTEDGLPHNTVQAISQTGDGYLWIGTREGLTRFDGVRFVRVAQKSAPEAGHASISALCAAADGSLWAACEGLGLLRLKNGEWSHLAETNGLPNNQIKCLLEARDGALWIGTEAGAIRYKDGAFKTFTAEKNRLGDNSVRGLFEDRQGNIRLATKRGLSTLDGAGKISTLNIGLDYVGNVLRCVLEDRQGQIWLGSNEGLTCLRNPRTMFYGLSDRLPDRIVNVIHQDSAGQYWVGTYAGLVRIVDSTVIARPSSQMAFGDMINAIYEDREENLWVGGKDGLYRLTPARCRSYTTQQGLSYDNVMSVCEDASGAICIATWGGGLNRLVGEAFSNCGRTNGLTHDAVLSLCPARSGGLWAGMDFDGGLDLVGEGCRNLFANRDGLTNAPIRVIHEDKDGALWLGTSRGLKRFKDGQLSVFTTDQGLAGNTVLAICADPAGGIWLGTDGGLSYWLGGKLINYSTREGLSHNVVNALEVDPDGTLWIGTKGGGLNRFRSGHFSAYTTKQGLFSDEIYEIIEDDFGYLWMSCRTGIFRVSKKSIDQFDQGTVRMLTSTPFGRADGLVSVQCNGVSKPAGWKGRDGRLWFPTIRGVVEVDSRIKANERPPPIWIEEVIADKRILSSGADSRRPSEPVTVPAGRGELEIHFSALSFQAPEKNRFKYRLDEVDSAWIDAGAQRVAHYYNVAPGRYVFRVAGCNNDGVWNEAGSTLALVVLPHFWQTWLFKLALLALALLVLSMIYRAHVARLRELERLRVRIAANLHDDVGARLTKVAMVTELLERQSGESAPIKARIRNLSQTTGEIIQAMDEIVWTINPKNDTLENLANYLFHYAEEYFQNTMVRCRLDVPVGLPHLPVSTEERHNLFMAVKEAFNNVLKHASASEVRFSLALENGKLVIVIADNGRGFMLEQGRSAGNGLGNMNERLEGIGGRLVVETSPGEGTNVRMEVNVK